MKLLRKVKTIEVKRCYVISDRTKRQKLAAAKKKVLTLSESQLDKILLRKNHNKRRDVYNRMEWYAGTVKTSEVGVWKKAGGLPLAWTRGSLQETGEYVRNALRKNPIQLTERSRRAIPGILKHSLKIIQTEKYLLPIILPSGTIKICRSGLRKMKGEIDDGCMRSVALAVSGKKQIKAYIGRSKKK